MATVFTVAPSNRSNTEVQNKRKEFPIVSKQEHFASMVFRHAKKKKKTSRHIKINKILEKDEKVWKRNNICSHAQADERSESQFYILSCQWLHMTVDFTTTHDTPFNPGL